VDCVLRAHESDFAVTERFPPTAHFSSLSSLIPADGSLTPFPSREYIRALPFRKKRPFAALFPKANPDVRPEPSFSPSFFLFSSAVLFGIFGVWVFLLLAMFRR
jgi:hypothetical protein